ncbi:MAG: DUF58 domain-containing protein [Candidatus Hydrogenedentes bacterium]|nr:DUF58 domain-containing protein [Candidatus Hydrogenedentota bacterium]
MAGTTKYLDPKLLSKLGNMELIARCALQGFFSGLHPSPFHGFSAEFSDHRQYLPGDELRFLDWKMYGRSNKLYIKQFLQDTNVPVYILLDASNSMTYRGDSTYDKLDYGRYLSGALTSLMLSQGDSVSLVVFSERVTTRIPLRGRRTHLHAILTALSRIEPGGRTRLADVLHTFAETATRRGIVILISDLLDDGGDLSSGLAHLKYLRHDVIVFHTLAHEEITLDFRGAVQFEDLETRERLRTFPESVRETYQAKVQDFIDTIEKSSGRSGIDYCLLDTSQSLDRAFLAYLAKRRRLM